MDMSWKIDCDRICLVTCVNCHQNQSEFSNFLNVKFARPRLSSRNYFLFFKQTVIYKNLTGFESNLNVLLLRELKHKFFREFEKNRN